jgi:hypothetical protein
MLLVNCDRECDGDRDCDYLMTLQAVRGGQQYSLNQAVMRIREQGMRCTPLGPAVAAGTTCTWRCCTWVQQLQTAARHMMGCTG